jgi:hypothetical protein
MGARAVITNPPPWLPPEQIELLVEGYTEVLGVYTWDIEFNASPGEPMLVATADDAAYGIADTDGTELALAADADDTALTVTVTAGPAWGAAGLPYDVVCRGERMTVTGITAPTSTTRVLTVTRGVNGVTVPLPAGAELSLAHTAFAPL